MSIRDKIKAMIGIDEEDFIEDVQIPPIEPPVSNMPTNVIETQVEMQPKKSLKTMGLRQQTKESQVSTMNGNPLMNKVIISEPKVYSDTQEIADCLKKNLPVFVNLQRVDKGEGRRIIDFLSGTIYAVDGDIQRVGNDLFLCTPINVSTEGAVSESDDELEIGNDV